MRTDRSTAARLLALLYAIGGASCLVAAVRPMDRATPVVLLGWFGVVGLALAGALWSRGGRWSPSGLQAALALVSVLIGVLAWRSATAVGVVGLGPVVLGVGVYAAFFFPRWAARAHAVLVLGASSAGAWAAAPSGFLVPWLNTVLAVAVITEVQGRLSSGLQSEARTDPLTGAANRRAWEADAERQVARAARTGEPVTIALLDLDHFKEVNDEQGHGAGDELLCELVAGWQGRLRGGDALGRIGGDEFALCLPGTDAAGARALLEQLTEAHPFTWSTGAATGSGGETVRELLARADAELYAAKRTRGGDAGGTVVVELTG